MTDSPRDAFRPGSVGVRPQPELRLNRDAPVRHGDSGAGYLQWWDKRQDRRKVAMAEEPIRVLAAEDDPFAQRAIAAYLSGVPDIVLVGVAADGQEALELAKKANPDLLLADIHMPGMDGIELVRAAVALPNPPRALCFTSIGDEATMRAALEAGASPRLMAGVLRSLSRRGTPPAELTQTEIDLVRLVGRGLDNAAIGDELHLAPSTVKTYLSRLLRRTDCQSRAQLAVRAHQWELVD